MPRLLNYTLPGGENTTRGGRGLADITVSGQSSLMNSLAGNSALDYNPDLNNFGAAELAALDAPALAAGAPSLGPTGSDIANQIASSVGIMNPSVPSWVWMVGIGAVVLLVVKR